MINYITIMVLLTENGAKYQNRLHRWGEEQTWRVLRQGFGKLGCLIPLNLKSLL